MVKVKLPMSCFALLQVMYAEKSITPPYESINSAPRIQVWLVSLSSCPTLTFDIWKRYAGC